jgi:hypothetical protein
MVIIEKIIFASLFLLLGGFLGAVQRTREDPQAVAERKPLRKPELLCAIAREELPLGSC